jgi:hypothetical protein
VEYFDYSQPQTPCWDDTATPKRVAAISDPGVCVALLPARKTRMPETRTGPRAESYSTLLFNQASCWAQSDDNNPQSPSSQPLHFRGFSVVVDLSRHLSLRSWSLLSHLLPRVSALSGILSQCLLRQVYRDSPDNYACEAQLP